LSRRVSVGSSSASSRARTETVRDVEPAGMVSVPAVAL
jgi:hypothetical protein